MHEFKIYRILRFTTNISRRTGIHGPIHGLIRSPFLFQINARSTGTTSSRFGSTMSTDDEVGSPPPKRVTRDALSKVEREKYVSMSLSEKRKLYRCGNNYVTLNKVSSWPEYFTHHISGTEKRDAFKMSPLKCDAKYIINDECNSKVSIWQGDITRLEVDAIVNAANRSLLGGGGVDGAIHSAAGKLLKQECVTLGGCQTGDAKVTGGYNLPAKYVIHTVGPVGEQESALQSCYERCLQHMARNNIISMALPCISTGVYGYPNEKAAPVAIETVRKFLQDDSHSKKVKRIVFCLFLDVDVKLYEHFMQIYFPIKTAGQ